MSTLYIFPYGVRNKLYKPAFQQEGKAKAFKESVANLLLSTKSIRKIEKVALYSRVSLGILNISY